MIKLERGNQIGRYRIVRDYDNKVISFNAVDLYDLKDQLDNMVQEDDYLNLEAREA